MKWFSWIRGAAYCIPSSCCYIVIWHDLRTFNPTSFVYLFFFSEAGLLTRQSRKMASGPRSQGPSPPRKPQMHCTSHFAICSTYYHTTIMLLASREPGKPIIIHKAVLLQVFRVKQNVGKVIFFTNSQVDGSFVRTQYAVCSMHWSADLFASARVWCSAFANVGLLVMVCLAFMKYFTCILQR